MPQLVPVDHDPFGVALTPVDHDPFAGDQAAMMPETFVPPAVGDWVRQAAPKDVATLQAVGRGAVDQAMVVKRLMDAAAEDGQHYIGEPDYVPQAIGPAAEVAMMLAGGAPLVAERGAAGIFGGDLMKTWDSVRAYQAEQLAKEGYSPERIWRITGTGKGADGLLRQEINDSAAKIVNANGGTLGEVMDHPELYKAYPQLKGVKVEPLPLDSPYRGMWDPNTQTLKMNPGLSIDQYRSTLLHEAQHAVQDIQGFARGGNANEFMQPGLAEAAANFEKVRGDTLKDISETHGISMPDLEAQKTKLKYALEGRYKNSPEFAKAISDLQQAPYFERINNLAKSEMLLAKAEDERVGNYLKIMGEVESRNTQKRAGYNLEERREAFPWEGGTQSVPTAEQIMRPRGGRLTLTPVEHDPFI